MSLYYVATPPIFIIINSAMAQRINPTSRQGTFQGLKQIEHSIDIWLHVTTSDKVQVSRGSATSQDWATLSTNKSLGKASAVSGWSMSSHICCFAPLAGTLFFSRHYWLLMLINSAAAVSDSEGTDPEAATRIKLRGQRGTYGKDTYS
jgi:hypothetical protein